MFVLIGRSPIKRNHPCEQQRLRGSYFCKSQPDSSVLKLTPAKKLDYKTHGYKVVLNFARKALQDEELVVDLNKFCSDQGIFFIVGCFSLLFLIIFS